MTFFFFFSYFHRTIGRNWGPQGFSSIRVYWSMSNLEHLGLFRSYLPHTNLELYTVSFMDSLFFKEHSIKISKVFLIGSTSSQSFNLGRIH